MKYTTLSTAQLLLMTVLMAVLSAILVAVNTWYIVFTQLPLVHIDTAGACVKVDNFQNGHAFNCNDVGVLLRQYRSKTAE